MFVAFKIIHRKVGRRSKRVFCRFRYFYDCEIPKKDCKLKKSLSTSILFVCFFVCLFVFCFLLTFYSVSALLEIPKESKLLADLWVGWYRLGRPGSKKARTKAKEVPHRSATRQLSYLIPFPGGFQRLKSVTNPLPILTCNMSLNQTLSLFSKSVLPFQIQSFASQARAIHFPLICAKC